MLQKELWFGLGLVLVIFLTLICAVQILMWVAGMAHAHDQEQWIADAQLTDPISHQWCCGPSDCHVLAPGDVREVHGGYMVQDHNGNELGIDNSTEFIPEERSLPVSQDGYFHRCIRFDNGKKVTRCFIVPPRSM